MSIDAVGLLPGTVAQSITVEVPPAVVWAAFADLERRGAWFGLPGERSSRVHELDFRVGGGEVNRSTFMNFDHEERLDLRTRFIELVENERITTAGELRLNEVLRFANLVSVLMTPTETGTRIDYTEQYQCFDVVGDGSAERGEREGGTRFLLRRLAIYLDTH